MDKIFNISNNNSQWSILDLIGMGKVRGAYAAVKFFAGLSTTTEGDLWYPGGDLVQLDEGQYLSVVSDDALDNGAGSGARTIKMVGLDSLGYIQYETVELNGLTPVITTKKFLRTWRMAVSTAGTTAGCVGNITASYAGDTQSYIKAGRNQTLMSHFTPPVDMSIIVLGGTLGASAGKSVHFHVKTRDITAADSCWKLKRAFDVYQTTVPIIMTVPRLVPSLTDYKWTQEGGAAGDRVSGDYSFILLENGLINFEEALPLGYETI